jgi:hypothetical protein
VVESGIAKAVLSQGDQVHVVRKGDSFAGSYRLEEIGPQELIVTYLPLEVQQSLPVEEKK